MNKNKGIRETKGEKIQTGVSERQYIEKIQGRRTLDPLDREHNPKSPRRSKSGLDSGPRLSISSLLEVSMIPSYRARDTDGKSSGSGTSRFAEGVPMVSARKLGYTLLYQNKLGSGVCDSMDGTIRYPSWRPSRIRMHRMTSTWTGY